MNAITKWFLDNPVAANLLMVFILIAGYLSFAGLRVESSPQPPPSQLVIEVSYPGGTAQQVDESITQRIEDAISGIAGIKSVTSASYAGFASVRVKKNTGVELSQLLEQVRNQVNAIVGFPDRAEQPKIYTDEFGNLASFVMIYGGENDATRQQVATLVANHLKKHPAISQVTNLGKRRKQLVIEPDADALKQYGLSYQDVANIIHQWSLNYRSGELDTQAGSITLKADNYSDTLPALAQIPLLPSDTGIVRLADIAEIKRDYEKTDSLVRYTGKAAIALMISTSQKDNLLTVSTATQSVLADLQGQLPMGVHTAVMADMAPYINEQLDLLGSNAWQGLLIVIVLLAIFLELRLALWVAMGIPIALAGAVYLMGLPAFDYSINDITLFGMILVLGILVDDAVVVGESIHQARSQIADPKQAAYQGVKAVSVATSFGVLTTIAAFSPMLWIENELAQVLAGFSAVVIFALIFSLIESKFILPTHLVLANNNSTFNHKYLNQLNQLLQAVRGKCTAGLTWFAEHCYQPSLTLALAYKRTCLAVFILLVLGAYGAMFKGTIRTVFFPEIPGRYATLVVEMDQDAAKALTQAHMQKIEQAITATNKALKQQYRTNNPVIEQYLVAMDGNEQLEATIALSNEALANVPSDELISSWQQHLGVLEGSYAQKFTFAEAPAGGTYLTVSAPSRDLARHVASKLKQSLAKLPGVNDITDDAQLGQQQLQVTLNQRGINLGLNQRQLAQLVGGAYGHIELHRLLDGGEEAMVLLRLPAQSRQTLQQLKNTQVLVDDQQYVTLSDIAEFSVSREPEVLHRKNRNQVVSVYWRQDKSIASPQQIWQQLQSSTVATLEAQYAGVSISAAGEFEEILEVQTGFKKAMLLTLLLIYVLLAIPLKSYWQPFIIMSVIPFGFAGAIYGHGLMGLSVSLLSMFGMMAMTGVVINDSLVLITRFNQLHRSGMAMKAALITAGKSRIRAIFLTTVTTVCGLLPLLSETSEQAQYLKPAAVSLVFGELFATPITLILIPVLLSFSKNKQPDSEKAAITTSSPSTRQNNHEVTAS
ncbi:AcrB/AcrD/AcrF family protein [Thalassotalea euphylliae]|uniref:AcrB/AcrD/AcrF family protein n=1 Tax=Thalassotalea euphylliae TaxID=1655234 RepID=A0A3E0TNX4_9GAMM|nr:efflux RND transporter permease subunit [Thalassotalea euphylliae]REL26224.1 AcrB/AcrD/AcrF family protein [Thalassotalea euphylliae]